MSASRRLATMLAALARTRRLAIMLAPLTRGGVSYLMERERPSLPPEVSPEVASKKLAQAIRRALANMRPSRWTDFGLLSHLVLGPCLRAAPVPKELLQSRQPAELEPESEATADWRGIGREVLHSPTDQVLGRLELPFPAYVNRSKADRRRRGPSHGSGAVGEEPIPVSR
jgi:hypothetical protein